MTRSRTHWIGLTAFTAVLIVIGVVFLMTSRGNARDETEQQHDAKAAASSTRIGDEQRAVSSTSDATASREEIVADVTSGESDTAETDSGNGTGQAEVAISQSATGSSEATKGEASATISKNRPADGAPPVRRQSASPLTRYGLIALGALALIIAIVVAVLQYLNATFLRDEIEALGGRVDELSRSLDSRMNQEVASRRALKDRLEPSVDELRTRIDQVALQIPPVKRHSAVDDANPLTRRYEAPPVPPVSAFDEVAIERDVLVVARECLAMPKNTGQVGDILRQYGSLSLTANQVGPSERPHIFVVDAGSRNFYAIPNTTIWSDLAPWNVFETEGQTGPGARVEDVIAPARVELKADGTISVKGSRYGKVRVRL